METGNSISIYPGDESVWFAFKTKGKTKIESFAVKRWPLELAGTEAVKEDSWTGREDVEYVWKEGGLFSLSKGSFAVKPGYLYSIFVFWKSSESPAQGWTEFSFTTDKANVQSGSNCGLNCETCEARIATIGNDDALREKVARDWSALNGVEITPEMINCVLPRR